MSLLGMINGGMDAYKSGGADAGWSDFMKGAAKQTKFGQEYTDLSNAYGKISNMINGPSQSPQSPNYVSGKDANGYDVGINPQSQAAAYNAMFSDPHYQQVMSQTFSQQNQPPAAQVPIEESPDRGNGLENLAGKAVKVAIMASMFA